jgi:uncharacterized membrane protein
MDELDKITEKTGNKIAKLPLLAIFVALIGLGDAIYLTIHHYTAEPVPCSILTGCEQVLTSKYATLGGIPFLENVSFIKDVPLAVLGGLAYLTAILLAVFSLKGNRKTWFLFGLQVTLMAIFSGWLLYLQGIVIEAFCQFCLLSAIITFSLFLTAIFSRFWRS